MKNNIVLLLSLFIFNASFAQTWNQLDVPTAEHLNEIYFTTEEKGFIVGNNGLLLKTIDGGTTWTAVEVGVTHNLMAISFVNTELGYINGLKTTDGGDSWVAQASSEIFGLMHCISENNIIAGHGDNFGGDIYLSTDGGDSWEVSSNPMASSATGTTGMYNDCYFVNAEEGYLSTWYSDHLFKTVDAGSTWSEIVIDVVDGNSWSSDDFRSVYFPTPDIGLVTHQDGLLKTTDAGMTWSEIKPDNLPLTYYPQSIFALSTEHYILVGFAQGFELERIYETTDGGASWTAAVSIIYGLFDVQCTASNCFAVGLNGTVYQKEVTTTVSNEDLKNSTLSFYPNPAQDFLQIENSSTITAIKIFNLEGKLLNQYTGHQNRIDLTHLNSGMYLFEVKTAEGIATFKFIKK